MASVNFRWIGEDELPTIRRVAEDIWWRYYHPELLSEAQVRYMLDWMYSPESLRAQSAGGTRFLLAEAANDPVGFASVKPDASVAEISKFYVHPDHHGQGVGSRMMRLCEAEANASEVELWVYRMNIKAINFYFSQGFRIFQTVDRPIGQGFEMNDFVMRKRLSTLK